VSRIASRLRAARLIDVLLVGGLLLVIWAIFATARPPAPSKPPATVAVQRGTVISTVSADGNVEPPQELSLGFESGGRLVMLAVREGQRVRRGQLLARVEDRRARAQLASAHENLRSAQTRLRQTAEGRTVAELVENQRLADQSRTAVRNAQRDLTAAGNVATSNVAGLRRAVARARVSGEEADLRASQLRLSQEQGEVTRLGLRLGEINGRVDRLRAELNDQYDRRRDVENRRDPSDLNDSGNQQDLNDVEAQINVLENDLSSAQHDQARTENDLDTARANLRSYIQDVESDRVALRDARRRLGDATDDLRNGLATAQQQIASARSSLAASEAELNVTLAENRVDEQGPRAADLAADLAGVASARATVEDARQAVADTELRAPVNGVVGKIDAEVGELVGAGSRSDALARAGAEDGSESSSTSRVTRTSTGAADLSANRPAAGSGFITMAQTEGLQVKVGFNETDAAKLRTGDAATISVDALPDKKFAAHVAAIDRVETIRENVVTYDVTLVLDSPQADLKPGMTATADVIVDEAPDVLTIPRTAVHSAPGAAPTVTVVRPDGRRRPRLVITGLEGDGNVQIVGGLGMGERIVRTAPASKPSA
jgi:HlyD family secretion protein